MMALKWHGMIVCLLIFCCIVYFNFIYNYKPFPILDRNKAKIQSTTPSEEILEIIKKMIADQKQLNLLEKINGSSRTGTQKPLQVVIITTWRSGSTFLGQILNSQPGNYYHYEPLGHLGLLQQIRDPPMVREAFRVINKLLHCDYADLHDYMDYQRYYELFKFKNNARLWKQCLQQPFICYLPEFLTPFCKTFQFQSMKITRLRLQSIEKIFRDPTLNVRVILLVRDPRGTMHSRRKEYWCERDSDCGRTERLCSDLVSDHSAAKKLKRQYPSRFTVIRYEDLSLDPHGTVQGIFDFLDLEMAATVTQFLDSHTKIDLVDETRFVGGSTLKNSAVTPFRWRNDSKFGEVLEIEDECELAMDLWGYLKIGQEKNGRLMVPFQL